MTTAAMECECSDDEDQVRHGPVLSTKIILRKINVSWNKGDKGERGR